VTEPRVLFFRHHPYEDALPEAEVGFAPRIDADDLRIADRVAAAYRKSAARNYYGSDSVWRAIRHDRQRGLHELFLTGSAAQIAAAVRDPKGNHLLYGIESVYEGYEQQAKDGKRPQRYASRTKSELVRLAEALGLSRLENPEGGPWLESIHRPTDELVRAIEEMLGFPLAPKWCFEGAFGLKCRSGVLLDRMIHGAYCAHRLRALGAGKVLEIGAGVGYLARCAHEIGIDYTIVDLPMTSVVQGYFLMRALGEDAVALEGEPARAGQIRVRTPSHLAAAERYDLVVNVDSLTEVGLETAAAYLKRSFEICDRFLSVNHEANPFTVDGLLRERFPELKSERFPYWMRRGYVEEIISKR